MPISGDLLKQVREALQRSGYLLESRIVRALSDGGFFVEPNVAVLDPRTGKSRELDMLAEYYEHDRDHPNVSVKTHFAIEALNNPFPLVLLTRHPGSLNGDIETFLRYGTTPEPNLFMESLDLWEDKVGFDAPRYSQYCALTRKKQNDELMASHPDDFYSTLLKLAEFAEREFVEFGTREWYADDPFWRLWFWQAIVALGGDLLVATEGADGTPQIDEVDEATLVFNFHAAEQPRSLSIHIVRETHLSTFLNGVLEVDRRLRERIHSLRVSTSKSAT